MGVNFSKIDQLVSDFEAELPVQVLLEEINEDEELRWEWGHDHLGDIEFYFVIHERSVFFLDDHIEDYYESDYLMQLGDEQIPMFIYQQIESCIESGDAPAVHFCEVSESIVSAIGEVRGQAGIGFVDMDITKSRFDKFQKLLDQGYLFLPNEHFALDEKLLIEKYEKLIREQLPKG